MYGLNVVILMLYYCLYNFRIGENECIIYVDKCIGSFVFLFLVYMLVFYSYFFFFNYNIDLFVLVG